MKFLKSPLFILPAIGLVIATLLHAADVRIKDIATTSTVPASDDYVATDGTTNGTRKIKPLNFFTGTSGGIPFFSASNTIGTSAALASGNIVVGGGAGATPATVAVSYNTTNSTLTVGAAGVGNLIANVITGSNLTVTTLNATNITLTDPVPAIAGGTGVASYTKGDIIVGNNTTTVAKLAVGTNGQVLTANSSATYGVEWGAVGSGNVVASATFGTDNRLIRSDGTGRDVQGSNVTLSDADALTGLASITSTNATIAGNLTVGNLTSVTGTLAVLDNGALSTDDTWSGSGITGMQAGATIAQWEAVYMGGSSKWLLADANGSGTYPARGLAVAAYADTNASVVVTRGTVRNDAWNWTVGGTIYLSTTAGGLTQTAPATSGDKVQQVGFALTADIAFFDFASGEYLTVQ